jgi:hypothetical protein
MLLQIMDPLAAYLATLPPRDMSRAGGAVRRTG